MQEAVDELKRQLGRGLGRSNFFTPGADAHPQESRLKARYFEEIALRIKNGEMPPMPPRVEGERRPSKRSQLNSIAFMLTHIWEYGCWCYFGEDYGLGHGAPVNHVDDACQALNLCYRCVAMDLLSEGRNDCNPGTEDYNAPVRKDPGVEGMMIACQEENAGDNCKIYTCTCEAQFIATLVEFFFTNAGFDPSYKHSLGQFDPVSGCPTSPGNTDKECCGHYPQRFPYSIDTRNCCEQSGKTYNPAVYECCVDGTVKPVC